MGVIASISSLSFFVFIEFINSEVVQGLLLGTIGSIIGAAIIAIPAKLFARKSVPSVFISYHHEDKAIALKIASEIRKVSSHVWMDDMEIHVGDNVVDKIAKGLSESDYFVIVLSDNAVKSKWAEMELSKAIELEKAVLPIKIDDSEIPSMIKNIAYADFRNSFDTGLDKLIKALVVKAHNKANSADAPKARAAD